MNTSKKTCTLENCVNCAASFMCPRLNVDVAEGSHRDDDEIPELEEMKNLTMVDLNMIPTESKTSSFDECVSFIESLKKASMRLAYQGASEYPTLLGIGVHNVSEPDTGILDKMVDATTNSSLWRELLTDNSTDNALRKQEFREKAHRDYRDKVKLAALYDIYESKSHIYSKAGEKYESTAVDAFLNFQEEIRVSRRIGGTSGEAGKKKKDWLYMPPITYLGVSDIRSEKFADLLRKELNKFKGIDIFPPPYEIGKRKTVISDEAPIHPKRLSDAFRRQRYHYNNKLMQRVVGFMKFLAKFKKQSMTPRIAAPPPPPKEEEIIVEDFTKKWLDDFHDLELGEAKEGGVCVSKEEEDKIWTEIGSEHMKRAEQNSPMMTDAESYPKIKMMKEVDVHFVYEPSNSFKSLLDEEEAKMTPEQKIHSINIANPSEKDIRVVREQANCDEESAIRALKINDNDIVDALMLLTM